MIKTINVLVTFLLLTTLAFSQEIEQKPKHKIFYIGAGGILTSFQDIKFSNNRYSGLGLGINAGFQKTNLKSLWEINLNLLGSNENARTFDNGGAIVLNGILGVKYLRPVFQKGDQKIYLGGSWDVLDFYVRIIEDLGNNGVNYVAGSNLKFSSMYERPLNQKLRLQAGLDLQLLSFMKELTSFSFSAPQDGLEAGEFSYQNSALENPFGFKNYNIEPLWNYFNIGTFIKLHYSKRLSFSYRWNMQKSMEVEGYPLVRGYNALGITYNLTNK